MGIVPRIKVIVPRIKVKVSYTKRGIAISDGEMAYAEFRKFFDIDEIEMVEHVLMICVDKAHQPIGYYKLSKGGTDHAVVDRTVVCFIAVSCLAAGVILAHNHPSGSLVPS